MKYTESFAMMAIQHYSALNLSDVENVVLVDSVSKDIPCAVQELGH